MRFIDYYYILKPSIPRVFQLAARRAVAASKRTRYKETWPIDPSSAKPPDNWPGWPDGKKFAFVLRHDVDTAKGRDRCSRLLNLDTQLGFRPSFYFVPEGYVISRGFIESFAAAGIEVGVHGLKHDGKLYRSPSAFFRRKPKINHYLKAWGASGFVSPSSLKDHSLMGELDIEYGCSTFDTDPFEPQSSGAGTIFPFYTEEGPGTRRYLELPYTLPQDHCLFIILREKDNRIWKDKIDWIAARGGMAALVAHPDYMCFAVSCSREEYPVELYEDILDYIRTKYEGQYWHAGSRELARFWNKTVPMTAESDKSQGTKKMYSLPVRRPAKVWIDLDNTPHVPFFIPIIRELESRGHEVVLTARDAFQVRELAAEKGLPVKVIGRHYGKNPVMKMIGLVWRSGQLLPFWLKHRPDFALSHGARSQILLSNFLRVPAIMIMDYEFARSIPFDRPRWMIVPEAVSDGNFPVNPHRIRHYPGIKEDVYAPDFEPDSSILNELGLRETDIVVTCRPPADEAHYHNPDSDILMLEFMARVISMDGVRTVLLPRNRHQKEHFETAHPEWFEGSRTIIPPWALDGVNLLWHSDLVVSGGGTMNREAAALGVAVYSIFRGAMGAVDTMLEREGRLTMIRSPKEVWTKIRIEKRPRDLFPDKGPRPALKEILYHVENIIDIERVKRIRVRKEKSTLEDRL